ncbi:MFS transporter [Arthrobacter sp. 260]|uniref:MFS transporter n=1 Tax=Arthrobacter sp. 260 TaxID=2735314 RepID=UPI001E2EDC6F|nr:MFS transporter [Arthrobacter sp. 260]
MTEEVERRPRGGLAAMCITQTTSWGLLYYSLPVAVVPIAQDTGWSAAAITAAFSAGLIVSAVVGIWVGRLLDQRGPRRLMVTGSLVGVAALLLVAAAPNLPVFVAAWLVAGLAQAAVFYQPAFVVLTRWYGPARVRALTTLTLVAGFASPIYAPLTALLIESVGWRSAYVVLAVALAVVTIPLHWFFLNAQWSVPVPVQPRQAVTRDVRMTTRSRRFIMLQVAVAAATLALFAVTFNLIPLLLERGLDYRTAVLAFSLIGVGQVIGRLFFAVLPGKANPVRRAVLLLAAGATSLWLLGLLPGPAFALIAVTVLAGAVRGCVTLLQATAVADRWGTANFGAVQGVFVAPVTAVGALAPAAGPLLAGLLGGYPAMALAMAGVATLGVLAAARS